MNEFREKIKDNHINIKEFSKSLEIPYKTMYNWFSGATNPPPYLKYLLLKELDIFIKNKENSKNEKQM